MSAEFRLFLSALLVLLAATAEASAQIGSPPNRPNSGRELSEPADFNPAQTPKFPKSPLSDHGAQSNEDANRVWKCSKCNAVIGRGATEPQIEVCPHCGAKLTSWFNYWVIGGVGGAIVALFAWLAILSTGRRNPPRETIRAS